ncbi:Co2+/Mg2+ efflux protein ApaG [Salinispirillum sp. LH 10-3-1]|uniref:Protein ApaG n=1 Tax=Salinispirillum sp. LH 10-3-1 TaxID=2952525 RepID=A0AB38YI71_9GAMM
MTAVAVRAKPQYLAEQSNPDQQRYVFAYTILISNEGEEPVQLLHRFWLITDGNGQTQEVYGEGVIGEQPVIEPGGTYVYTSGAVSQTEVATMQGYYEMVTADGEPFRADIPVFTLAVPNRLN